MSHGHRVHSETKSPEIAHSATERLARAIAHHPWIVLGAIAAISALAAHFALRVRIDSSAERLIQSEAPATQYYEEVRGLFGNEEVDAVVVLGDDAFSPSTLEKVKRLDERLAALPGVDRVRSLASLEVVTAGADGSVSYGPAMSAVPATTEAVDRFRRLVRGHPVLDGTFVSADGRASMLLVEYRPMPESEFVRRGIVERVKAVLEAEAGPEEIHLIGAPALRVGGAHSMRRDAAVFTPVAALVIVVVLLLSFRSARGVLLPLATVGVGLLWTIGLMGVLGAHLDVVCLVLPSLLLAIGSAYSTHVVARYYDEAESGGVPEDVVMRMLAHIGLPVFVTAFTTLLGFASLAAYRIPTIRSFAGFATFGVAAIFVLSLTFTAAILVLLPVPRRRAASVGRDWPWLRRWLDVIVRFDVRRRGALLVGSVAVMLALGYGIFRIELDTNYTNYFPRHSAERIAADVVDRHLGGFVNFLVVVDGPGPDALTRVDVLRGLDAIEETIDRMPGIARTSSIVDVVKLVHRALHDDDPAALALPQTDAGVQQYLLLVPPEATEPFLLPDASRAVIRVRSSIQGSRELAETLREIERVAPALLPRGFSVRTTGSIPLINRTADDLSTGQVQSILIALTVVFATMATFFVSFRLGLVAMLPNLVPIVIYFGLLGWTGTPLGLTTALIASMVLGLGVDEAIHLLSEFNVRLRNHGDQERAIREAMSTVGPPVVFTTAALSLGALAQTLSGFIPIQQFALFSALNVFTSLLADVILLPAFVASIRFVTLWDLMTLKLGRSPERTIPLFAGLSASQARIAVLMGQLRNVAEAEPIVRQGEPGESMFVLLFGRAEIRVERPEGLVAVATLGRGDVIGEMGLLRREARSATAVALEPSELLVVDQRFLETLVRRYPRIAAVVLMNLSRMLSDRVHRTTARLLEAVGGADASRTAA